MTVSSQVTDDQRQYLTFLLAGEEYAISILRVKEIIGYDTLTVVPKTPTWVRGVINLRGNVVPVVDLAIRFGLADRPVSKTTCIIIVEWQLQSETIMIGLIADSVSQVMDIAASEILDVPAFGTHVRMDYLSGMAQLGKKFALLLDIDKVLSSSEVLDLHDAASETSGTDKATLARHA